MLQSSRLLLRETLPDDLQDIHQLLSLPETDQFNTLGIPATIDASRDILDNWLDRQHQEPRSSYVFRVGLVQDNTFVGLIGLKLGESKYRKGEVWFKTHKTQWRKGYTSEALQLVLQFGFDGLQLHRIEAGCAVDNIASVRTLEKSGFVREGMKRQHLPIRGEWKDNYFYGILESEFHSYRTG